MYTRLSAVMFPILAIALAAVGIWGYQEHQDKNAVLIKAENQYQRSFHDLSFHIASLHKELGHALAVNAGSHAFLRKSMANVWRLTSQAQGEINQLPLSLLPFHKTEEFLANISNFAYRTSLRDLRSEPLSDGELKTLQALYERSHEISNELKNVQAKVIRHHLRWMDVEMALATQHEQMDNTIIDGFKTVDNKVGAYPELDWGAAAAAMHQDRSTRMLSGSAVTPQDIKRKAAGFLHWPSGKAAQLKVVENGKGTEYSSYSVSAKMGDREYQLDYSKKGGRLLWYMADRPIKSKKLSPDQAVAYARKFLKAHGFPDAEPVNYTASDNSAGIVMVPVHNDVLIYPRQIGVNVALDNGEVIGLNVVDYAYESDTKALTPPKMRPDEARKFLNKNFQVQGEKLALIRNDMNRDVLCYEFTGRINGGTYRIFINATDGAEEKVETIDGVV
ncbi:MAG TPA: germination protein YpeB [Bacilli bacterium]